MREKANKFLRGMIYVLPGVLLFSYHPVISLGASESMNFELSLPLIWLVVFDLVACGVMWKRRVLIKGLKGKWAWMLLPLWLTISVLWSLNTVRGVLTAGVLWLLYIAGYAMWSLRKDVFSSDAVRGRWWKWFYGAALVGCVWCVVQCGLDLAGVGREYSLMCAGCTYSMFGFPHPNGFAIEPQFMGNLLLAPAIVAMWLYIANKQSKGKNLERKPLETLSPIILYLVLTTTLFLTFSRGAIYAFLVGVIFMSALVVVRAGKKRGETLKRVGIAWGVIVVAGVVAVNVQGLMAEVSPTKDTYQSGVAKVLNHMSLGVIDVRDGAEQEVGQGGDVQEVEPVENVVENSEVGTEVGSEVGSAGEEAAFDGYVAESTDARLRLTDAAMQVWSQDFKTVMFGVGLGGAGQALYDNGLSPAPKEIVQNQYASLLLETGLIGALLLVVTLVMVVRAVVKTKNAPAVLALMVAYAVSVCFFSGLPNALHIYLLPMVLVII